MQSRLLIQAVIFTLALPRSASADCRSSGTDFVNGGGPYCVNSTSSDFFSFGTEFEGCVASDTQNGVTPILIDPNSNEFYCSDIATNPDDTEMRSTCNVANNQVRKNSMVSGTWIVVIEGLTFAWMRSFSINAAPPVTIYSTTTATFSVTSTPSVTSTTTSTSTITTTLAPNTITVPSTTLTITNVVTPVPVTITTTSYLTLQHIGLAFATTVKTLTQTTQCITKISAWDPKCTITPRLATLVAAKSASARKVRVRGRYEERDLSWAQEMRNVARANGLLEPRSADACSTTVLATTNLPSLTITITAPTFTVIITKDTTQTATVTPPNTTLFSGRASKTITTTKPTQTLTQLIRAITDVTVTNTIWATLLSVVKVPPTGVVCISS